MSDKQQFTTVFQQGKRSADSRFTVLACANGLTVGRLGLVISRKAARRATARNRLKRLAREVFRQQRTALTGFDVVVMAKPGADRLDNAELRESLERLYSVIPRRCEPSSKR